MIDIHRGVPSVVYCGYDIATVLRNVEGITDYGIGRARVRWLCVCVCYALCVCMFVLGELLCIHVQLKVNRLPV